MTKNTSSNINRATLELIGCASGVAGADSHCEQGPPAIAESIYLKQLVQQGFPLIWNTMLQQDINVSVSTEVIVAKLCEQLAIEVQKRMAKQTPFMVIGGDHSCAIGTWSGVAAAKAHEGDIGLIWIDAHMDSHTPETSITQHIHGMPLAALLGYGIPTFTQMLTEQPKLKPQNLCLIGVRSFEAGEAELLKRLNVKVYFMEEVQQKGFQLVLQEALQRVKQHTVGFGITLDLDSIDPQDAPGVDVPEANGIRADDLLKGLQAIIDDPKLLTAEIVEYDPVHDQNQMTEKLVVKLINMMGNGLLKHG